MKRIYNFSAGPSILPEAVLKQAQEDMLDWQGTGMSVMEMSHRGKHFSAIAAELEADLRELMGIPDNYKVLFMQGGATGQFSFIPMNILRGNTKACYVNTGAWSTKAIKDAGRFCEVIVSATSEHGGFKTIPDPSNWTIDTDAAYLHYTSNETIHGVEFPFVPDSKGLPLVSDMSSNILSRPVDVSQFGLIYAGTQKNMGPAGVTVVIVRDDLIGTVDKKLPDVFNYAVQDKDKSMLNTPASYNWYLVGLVLKWLKSLGGIAAVESKNRAKSARLYQAIDQSSLFSNPVDPAYRSRMNVPFILSNPDLDKTFLAEAEAKGLAELKGHRSVGGMRASIYNAMPDEGVDALIDFMKTFEKTHG
ncbi:3-phosphoserine/phosphohydroxythreonine transaminase [Methylicorpusculum sp.]|uniref:3-phosphoserine/phosphohydroxythreonine transaminase n=1 Tax=Methylicorpusculum sp. TaxID=2713644 RepID=UPI002730822F|nr:3-phosphoserine/phosphohydroxythreonine transaminase [Methylicorpusculum sp.]MDP2180242.1 3-phosphoserine/phosphohydroxythreonine transaminase [Methylicorpusculum sp.]MDP3528251.1 3-phosphoserine/phosphohydroxythreonine transaminase [Methylicorpusculum sp.]MDZ4152710.1 3-phosphoserine/phosphohydroxythreonine transaminase [Methylicorpusculum sp.]